MRGTLYIDHMESRTFTSIENWKRFCKDKPIAEKAPADSGGWK
jgi:hypothetical protein